MWDKAFDAMPFALGPWTPRHCKTASTAKPTAFIVPAALVFVVGAPSSIYLFRFHSEFFFHYLWNPARDPVFDTYSFMISVGLMFLLASATLGGWYSIPAVKPDNNYALFNLGAATEFGVPIVVSSVIFDHFP